MALAPGRRLGPYEILSVAGTGGMGEVYRARDTRLDRIVAIKVLPEELLRDPGRRLNLEREARTISSLSHPHICTLHDVGRQDDVDYLVMEHLEGETLSGRLRRGPLPLAQAVRHATEIAGALEAAHRRGIVHRDLKPGNIMLTATGAKLLDFGLAKLVLDPSPGPDLSQAPTVAQGPSTRAGALLGTPAYMSPEQVQGWPTDARTDVYSFGLVLYEMLAGRRPFPEEASAQLMAAILRDEPPSLRGLRPEAGDDLERVVDRCLRKDPSARYADGGALLSDLRGCEERMAMGIAGGPIRRRRWLLALMAAATLAIAALAAWMGWRSSLERRARRTALPEIERLQEAERPVEAFIIAREVAPLLRGDSQFEKLWRDVTMPMSLRTDPSGAKVFFKAYTDPEAEWIRLGVSPLEAVRAPFGLLRWRIVADGFVPRELAFAPLRLPPSVRLVPPDRTPPGMVLVPAGRYGYRSARAIALEEYWIDRLEVTNREYKKFVDQGGYAKREYWTVPFAGGGRTLSFEEAMARFRDATGRPGPSTWELGTYPEDQADFPVGGVSWYEAGAYARFAGKSLPTFHHWFRAAGADDPFSNILRFSNFGGRGPAPAGANPGLSPWGSYDMAGNVREWAWNAAGDRRYTLGGSWNDPTYLFTGPDAVDPFDRSPVHGFRCALFPAPPPGEAFGSIERIFRDYSKETPVGDEVFRAYLGLHRYDPGPLDVRAESGKSDSEYWREERISYAAAYNGERIPATLFLPKDSAPPYQAVLYFPPGSAFRLSSIRDAGTRQFAFLIRSGRAVLFPGYKNTFERRTPPGSGGPHEERDMVIQWSKDVGRSLDYLQSRPDIDGRRLAFYGLSMGAAFGPIAGAVDPRLRALVLVAGGLGSEEVPPEVSAFNFAPRVHVPVLMINGRHDFIFPLEVAQEPLFRLFPMPENAKRHHVFEGGHVPPHPQEIARETLDWLDRHLGPVRQATPN